MKTIMVEIRDRMTFIPALVVRCEPSNEAQRYLLRRLGFAVPGPADGEPASPGVLLVWQGKAKADPYEWGDRTLKTAHLWIEENIDRIGDGAVVDVEFILGEAAEPKRSESVSAAMEGR